MKKILSILLAVTLLAALAVPMTVSAAKVDLGTKAQEAINELAKYNTTPVGENFNVKTMMGYVFGTMTKDGKDSQYFDEDMGIRYVWYKIPAATLENKMLGCFANGRAAITEMTSMSVLDYTWEYGGKVADAQLKVYQPGYYYFNDYNLDRTEIVKGYPIKSKTGFVAENPKTYTVNGYKSAGGYKYDVYATDNTGAVVKFTIEWGGGDIKFVSTAAASSVPDVQFCHATGTQAHTANLKNFHNAFAHIYEGRYLAGVVAGLKLKEMMDADSTIVPKMGYVGAFTFAEVISGYTSFYLGAKSIVPNVTMDVKFTGSWYDETKEKQAAQALIDGGCVLISQHADSMGSPTACEAAKVPNVSYNGSTAAACPNTFLVSSRINWVPYFEYMITQVAKGEAIDTDWAGTLENGAVALTDLGTAVADGTAEKLAAVKKDLMEGKINVFDTANFTVKGEKLTSYKADVDTDAAFEKDTEAIENGVFYESKHRSGPYFDIEIDGITLLDRNYG